MRRGVNFRGAADAADHLTDYLHGDKGQEADEKRERREHRGDWELVGEVRRPQPSASHPTGTP